MLKPVSARIIEGSRDLWDGLFAHPFVKGIADGSLDIDKFRFFMIQDYLYLLEYAKVFSAGAAKSKEPEVMQAFNAYVSSIMQGELEIHRSYMKKLGITLSDAENAYMAQDNLSYTSYMLRCAYEGGPAEICAAVLPCAVSYEVIAKKMIADDPSCIDHAFYGDWIKGYASDGYHDENEALKRLTDKVTAGYSVKQADDLILIGRRCSIYEKQFWDASWEMRR